jgi:hypothetical protein
MIGAYSYLYIGDVKRDIVGIVAPYLLTLANRRKSYLCRIAQGGQG